MAIATAALASATVAGAMISKTQKRMKNVVYIGALNSFGGLKAHNSLVSLGLPECTEQCFAKVVGSLRATSDGRRRGGGGGALSSSCNAADEIFKIAAIINVLTLIGVAVGFVLLRIEAFVEESEE